MSESVKFFEGGINSNSETKFIEEIKKSADNNDNVLIIVPDQFSFEYEKKIYKAFGAVTANKIQSVGFNRLAELMALQYGASGKENASENAKIIMMYKAIKQLKKEGNIKFYAKSLDKKSFISEIIKLVEQFRESGITPEALHAEAENSVGSVSHKLFDISRLYKYYLEELDKANLQDSISKIAVCVKLAEKNGFFKDKCVFVSSFTSFSYDENKMIEVCIRQAKSFAISLIIDSECVQSYNNHPFFETVKTEQKIKDIAKAHNKNIQFIFADNDLYNNPETKYLSKNLFKINKEKFKGKCTNVKLISATDLYEETEYICSEITRLVQEEKYHYNDIAVTVRDLNLCSSVFENIFERYDIPYFLDMKNRVSASSLVQYLNSMFDCLLTKKYKTENIMKYIKSPLFTMFNYEVNNLEEYCIEWNVDGDMWTSPFTAKGERKEKDYLNKINGYREKIIAPFEKFKNASKNAGAKKMCKALYELFKEINLSKRTFSLVKKTSCCENETQLEMGRNLRQLWDNVLSAVKSIYDCLGDEKITLRNFCELFKLMLSQMSTSNPPQKLDCVRICDAGHSRLDNVKITFAAEIVEGVFPAPANGSGLITDREKELINSKGNICILNTARRTFQSEKLMSYCALSMASDKLYALYSEYDLTGKSKRPSILANEIKNMFDNEIFVKISDLPVDFFCTSYKTTYHKYLEHANDHTSITNTLKNVLETSEEYSNRLYHIEKLKSKEKYSLNTDIAQNLFLNNDINKISPTRLETYYKCPFQYFCSYGLNLKIPEKMKFDNLNKGKVIHNLLEKILSKKDGTKGYDSDFTKMTEEEIKEFISRHFKEYYNNELCGDFGKTETFKFLYSELEKNAFFIVKSVQDELNQTKFRPVAMEYDLSKKDNEDILTINLENNKKIILSGTIDRVDTYTDENGTEFVRIIDYKTGKIDLNYSKIYLGLNLQMFVYLSAILSGKTEFSEENTLKQAGVAYFQLNDEIIKSNPEQKFKDLSIDELKKNAQKERHKAYKLIGTMVDDENLKKAYGNINSNSKKSDFEFPNNEDLVTDNNFSALCKFACEKVREFGENLSQGKIDALPIIDTCKYCKYHNICPDPYPQETINPSDIQYKDKLLKKLNEISKEDNENEC